MMGRTHALSGVAGWLAGSAVLTAAGHAPSAHVVIVGGLVSAGCALLPDVDHPGSTVAHSLGPVTRLVAHGMSGLSAWTRRRTCAHCARQQEVGGHRMLTHTILFAVVLGGLAAVGGWLAGPWVGVPVVWLSSGLAARAMLPRRSRGAFGAVLLATVTALASLVFADRWWWIGLPVLWGTLGHSLGDAVTLYGVPLVWPLRVRGCRWARVGIPHLMRLRTDGTGERVVWVLLLVGTVGSGGYMAVAG